MIVRFMSVSVVLGWNALARPGEAWLGPILRVVMLHFLSETLLDMGSRGYLLSSKNISGPWVCFPVLRDSVREDCCLVCFVHVICDKKILASIVVEVDVLGIEKRSRLVVNYTGLRSRVGPRSIVLDPPQG